MWFVIALVQWSTAVVAWEIGWWFHRRIQETQMRRKLIRQAPNIRIMRCEYSRGPRVDLEVDIPTVRPADLFADAAERAGLRVVPDLDEDDLS